jgi:hypothetical protein
VRHHPKAPIAPIIAFDVLLAVDIWIGETVSAAPPGGRLF